MSTSFQMMLSILSSRPGGWSSGYALDAPLIKDAVRCAIGLSFGQFLSHLSRPFSVLSMKETRGSTQGSFNEHGIIAHFLGGNK